MSYPYIERDDKPNGRLTRICESMIRALEGHPELSDDQCCILLMEASTNETNQRIGGLVLRGYENELDAVTDLLVHVGAILKANGLQLQVHHISGNPKSN